MAVHPLACPPATSPLGAPSELAPLDPMQPLHVPGSAQAPGCLGPQRARAAPREPLAPPLPNSAVTLLVPSRPCLHHSSRHTSGVPAPQSLLLNFNCTWPGFQPLARLRPDSQGHVPGPPGALGTGPPGGPSPAPSPRAPGSESSSLTRRFLFCFPDPESQRKRTVQNVLDLRQNLEETMSSLRGSQVTHR